MLYLRPVGLAARQARVKVELEICVQLIGFPKFLEA